MKRMLMLASVASMIDCFNMSNIDILRKQGYEVHVAANFDNGSASSSQRVNAFKKELEEVGIPYYQIDFSRRIAEVFKNIKAYKQIKDLMQKYHYEFIHCHSPIGGVCGRLAAHSTHTPVIYTAHGFHFFKGAPLLNWLIYYPIEKCLAKYTDILITINTEDYTKAKRSLSAKKVVYIPGVGIDSEKYAKIQSDKLVKRKELGVSADDFLVLSVGELNKNKNHEIIIRAIAKLNNRSIHYVICGQGALEGYLRMLIKEMGLEEQVTLVGFRRDIAQICKAADVFAFPSKREGLPVSLMEAMASGLPVICSNIRGNTDLIQDQKGGYLVNVRDVNGVSSAIKGLLDSKEIRSSFSSYNQKHINKYSIENVKIRMKEIYFEL